MKAEEELNLGGYYQMNEILKMPAVINNVHESSYRCYHAYHLILEMVRRGDSKETILETAMFLKRSDLTLKE